MGRIANELRGAAFFLEAWLQSPVRPLTWVAPPPVRRECPIPGSRSGLLTLPGRGRNHPALVFSTGVRATEPLHKRVIRRTTDAFARIGVATLHLQSRHLDEGRVLPQEVTAHVGAFETLRDDPSINRERIGFVGLSATGSIAIAAAADERIRDDVWIVLALGTYFDAASLVAAVTSRHCRTSHGLSAWEPERLSEEVVRETVLSALDADDRVALER